MIKGAQKKMIVIKTADSEVFEEAYFVLRREKLAVEADMVREANRIIESGGDKRGAARKNDVKGLAFGIACFACGIATGGGIAALMLLL